jgi:pyridinium-3,5-bisthiocarboxylic acid mononucleotide nickel chelatase
VYFCERHIVTREARSVDVLIDGNREPIKVKVSRSSQGEIIRIKPEFDDLKRLAEKTGKPLRVLSELAMSRAYEELIQKK